MVVSSAFLAALCRVGCRLWAALGGESAMRLHRVLAVLTLGIIGLGAYWAMVTRDAIDTRMVSYEAKLAATLETVLPEMLRPRDDRLAALEKDSRNFERFTIEARGHDRVISERIETMSRDVAEVREQLKFLTHELLRSDRADNGLPRPAEGVWRDRK